MAHICRSTSLGPIKIPSPIFRPPIIGFAVITILFWQFVQTSLFIIKETSKKKMIWQIFALGLKDYYVITSFVGSRLSLQEKRRERKRGGVNHLNPNIFYIESVQSQKYICYKKVNDNRWDLEISKVHETLGINSHTICNC